MVYIKVMSIEKKTKEIRDLDNKINENIKQKRSLDYEIACLQDKNFYLFDNDIKIISEDIAYTLKWLEDNIQYIIANPDYIRNILLDLNKNFEELYNKNISQYKKDSFFMFFEYILEKLKQSLNEEDIIKIKNIISESLYTDISQELQNKIYNYKLKISPTKGAFTRLRNNREKKFKEGDIIKTSILDQTKELQSFIDKRDDVKKLGKRKEHTAKMELRKRPNTKLKVLQESFSPFWYYIEFSNSDIEKTDDGLNYFIIDPSRLNDDFLISLNLVEDNFKELSEYKKLEIKKSLIPNVRYILKNSIQLETYPIPKNYTSRVLTENTEHAKGKIILFQTVSGRYNKKYPSYTKIVSVFDNIYSFLRSQNHTLDSIEQKVNKLIEAKKYLQESKELLHNTENQYEAKNYLLKASEVLSNYDTFFEKRVKKDRLEKVLSKTYLKGYDINTIKAAINDLEGAILEKESQSSQISYQKNIIDYKRDDEKSIWRRYYMSFKKFLDGVCSLDKNDFFGNIKENYIYLEYESGNFFKEDLNISPFVTYQNKAISCFRNLSNSLKNKDLDNAINNIGKFEFILKLQRVNLFLSELEMVAYSGFNEESVENWKRWINSLLNDLVLESSELLCYGGDKNNFEYFKNEFETLKEILSYIEAYIQNYNYDSLKELIGKIKNVDIIK